MTKIATKHNFKVEYIEELKFFFYGFLDLKKKKKKMFRIYEC